MTLLCKNVGLLHGKLSFYWSSKLRFWKVFTERNLVKKRLKAGGYVPISTFTLSPLKVQ